MNPTCRKRIFFQGIVQGVGFRPFVYRLATEYKLGGFVQNISQGVITEIEGEKSNIQGFQAALETELPPLASISEKQDLDIDPRGEDSFEIMQSEEKGGQSTYISPDVATCEECLQELFDPKDRRYLYPFINCTNCGPRLTIIRSLPYDRSNTSMAEFPLCPSCEREYHDPANRRFHAEPNACPQCGPKLQLCDAKGREIACSDAVQKCIQFLQKGYIGAVKGLGGFHLCADPTDPQVVGELRKRKNREVKPLAVMVDSLDTARSIAEISPCAQRLLKSPQRPIVLARKKHEEKPCREIAPHMPNLGIMLPYTPLHHLLLAGDLKMLIMTSGNSTDEPICIKNREAVSRLSGIADFYLLHDREILIRCDDSIVSCVGEEKLTLRRSRGYAPKPVLLDKDYPDVFALGPDLKSTLGILRGREMFLSPHIGDLNTSLARDFLLENMELIKAVTRTDPDILACDMHPDYFSSRVAQESEAVTKYRVQHHHAHIVSGMAEKGLREKVIGLAMDGTGYGEDGRVWGGEVLLADRAHYQRTGHIDCFPLPGGEQAVKNPWRTAAALLSLAYGTDWKDIAREMDILPRDVNANDFERILNSERMSQQTSSCGRLFDAVAVLLGRSPQVHFEGQAAMELETLAMEGDSLAILPYRIKEEDMFRIDFIPAIREIVQKRQTGSSMADSASMFHATLVDCFLQVSRRIRESRGLNSVVLSGGCFQNRVLLAHALEKLREENFQAYVKSEVPVNDGGIALGQAVCAAERVLRDMD